MSEFLGTMPNRPVVAIDVDGTIGQYHDHFTKFARQYLGYNVVPRWEDSLKGEFSEALGLDKSIYRDIKLAYRQGGLKRSMPVEFGAKQMIESFIEAGIEVWFCTTRPWQRLDNIDPDTREFFRRSRLKYHGLIYGEDKYQRLVDIVGKDRIIAVIDDEPEQIVNAFELGLTAILRAGHHNSYFYKQGYEGFNVATTLDSAANHVFQAHKAWESVHNDPMTPADVGQEDPAFDVLDQVPATHREKQGDRGEFGMPAMGGVGWFVQLDEAGDEVEDSRIPASLSGISAISDYSLRVGEVSLKTLRLMTGDNTIEFPLRGKVARVCNIMDEAQTLYKKKAQGYETVDGDTADHLGVKGQFADINRKFWKLKGMLWDETISLHPDAGMGEDVEQVLMDFIGHAALTIDYIREAEGNKEEGS